MPNSNTAPFQPMRGDGCGRGRRSSKSDQPCREHDEPSRLLVAEAEWRHRFVDDASAAPAGRSVYGTVVPRRVPPGAGTPSGFLNNGRTVRACIGRSPRLGLARLDRRVSRWSWYSSRVRTAAPRGRDHNWSAGTTARLGRASSPKPADALDGDRSGKRDGKTPSDDQLAEDKMIADTD
jgi:hypothetical protein